MLILMLALQLIVRVIVLVLQLAVELGVLPRIEAFGVRALMLFVNLVMNVAMFVAEIFVLLLVTAVSGITTVT